MKIRNGFISNSSTTSFVIYTKKKLTKKFLLKKMRKVFSILKGTLPYYKIISRAVELFSEGDEILVEDDYRFKNLPKVDYFKEFKYVYRGVSIPLNGDTWHWIDDPHHIIADHITIYDDDFFMKTDNEGFY